MFLSYVKLFFLSVKRTLYHAYLTYVVYIDFFGISSLYPGCSKAVQVSLNTRQSVILQKTYSTRPRSSFQFCILFIWIKGTFFLYQHSKSHEKVKIYHCCIRCILFMKTALVLEKVIPVKHIKTKQFFNFFKLKFFLIILKI